VSLETLPENRERRCWGKVHRKTIPKIGGEDWEGPPADGSEIVGWHHKLRQWLTVSVIILLFNTKALLTWPTFLCRVLWTRWRNIALQLE